jgi:GAF domain-containing protein
MWTNFHRPRVQEAAPADDDVIVETGAIKAAAAASAASYRSFADATRSVLDLLERLMPGCALYLSHLDRTHAVHRVVDARGGAAFGLRSNLATPLADSYDQAMAEERAPRCCPDLAADPVYSKLGQQRRASAGSYLGVPLELSDGSRVGALAALAAAPGRFAPEDE